MNRECTIHTPLVKLKSLLFHTDPADWSLGIYLTDLRQRRTDSDDSLEQADTPRHRKIRDALRLCDGLTARRYRMVFDAYADWQSRTRRSDDSMDHMASSAYQRGFVCLEDYFREYARVFAYQLLAMPLFSFSVTTGKYDQSLQTFSEQMTGYLRFHEAKTRSRDDVLPSTNFWGASTRLTIPDDVICYASSFAPHQLLRIGLAF